jgi:hypothetical protein
VTQQIWSPEFQPVDVVIIGGQIASKLSYPIGAHAPRKIQAMAGPGFSGALYHFWGLDICKFKIRIHLIDDADWFQWGLFEPMVSLNLKTASSPQAANNLVINPLAVIHPMLNTPSIGITAIVVEDVHQAERVGEAGEWSIDLDVIGFRPLKMQSAKYTAPKDAPLSPDEQRALANEGRNKAGQDQLDALKNRPATAPKLP